jgi:hypothetical protein
VVIIFNPKYESDRFRNYVEHNCETLNADINEMFQQIVPGYDVDMVQKKWLNRPGDFFYDHFSNPRPSMSFGDALQLHKKSIESYLSEKEKQFDNGYRMEAKVQRKFNLV